MSCLLTSGRSDKICGSNISGISDMYLAHYQFFKPNEYTVNDNELTTFPSTGVYKFSLRSDENTFNESYNGEFHTQSINIKLPVISKDLVQLAETIEKNEYRIIIKTYNGLYKIFGLTNGLSVSNLNIENGSSKNSFNGVSLKFEGKELKESLYITSLEDVGFFEDNVETYTFQDFINYAFQDNTDYIF